MLVYVFKGKAKDLLKDLKEKGDKIGLRLQRIHKEIS